MEIKCIIVDDELPAIQLLEDYISRVSFLNILKTFNNGIDPIPYLQAHQVDVVFLDVEMEGFTGLQLIKTLKNKPKVILTTAYDQYAIDAFELDVCDYLLKPISFERFLKAVNKCCQVAENITSALSFDFQQDEFIYIKENKKVHKIFLSEILYIESMKEYVRLHTTDKKYLTKCSISSFEQKLPGDSFIRVHKSYIVSIPKIKSFTSTSIELEKTEIPISRTYKALVMNALDFKTEI